MGNDGRVMDRKRREKGKPENWSKSWKRWRTSKRKKTAYLGAGAKLVAATSAVPTRTLATHTIALAASKRRVLATNRVEARVIVVGTKKKK